MIQDPLGRMGPFARKGNQWVSFDDREMIRRKAELVQSMNLGGAMIWALDLDDFRGTCGQGKHPLLTQISSVLRSNVNELEGKRKFTLKLLLHCNQ